MLGKLMKHEWKSTYKICGALLIFLVLMTALACISFRTPMWSMAMRDSNMTNFVPTPLDFAGLMSLLFYILSMVGVVWGAVIYLGVHFYKTMYSEEGYLTHTLPVTSHQLLLGKILTGGFWYLLVLLVMLLSVFCLVFSLLGVAFSASMDGMSLWQYLAEHMDEIVAQMNTIFRFNLARNLIMSAVMIIIGAFTSVVSLFGAITVGQLFGKHRVMMSIVSYFAISVVSQIVNSLVTLPFSIANSRRMISHSYGWVNTDSFSISTSLISLAVSIVIAVVLYFVSNYIITKKLNLD